MALVVFADETGTHDPAGTQPGSEVACVAGYLSWIDDWIKFCDLWKKTLEEYKVEVFHMSDFARDDGNDPSTPYYQWNQERKDEFIHKLIAIARDNTLAGIGGLLTVKDYNEIVPQWLKDIIKHPYYFCFQLFFQETLKTLKDRFEIPFPSEEKVLFFFDKQQEFNEYAIKVAKNIQKLHDVDDRIGGISFEDKATYLPLQAADLLAYRIRKRLTQKMSGKGKNPKKGSWDAALALKNNLIMPYWDAEILKAELPKIIKSLGK